MNNVINTIPGVLSKVARKFASKTALFFNNGNTISYNDMLWDVSKTCRTLREYGIAKNSSVALFMDNSPQCIETFLAITKMGAVAILLDYKFSENQIKEIFAQEKPDAVFVNEKKLNLVLETENATVFAIDDNRALKQVSRQVKNSITEVEEKDNAVVMFVVTENGLLTKQVLTQKSFIQLTSNKGKTLKSPSFNSLVEELKMLIAPIFNGFTVNTSI